VTGPVIIEKAKSVYDEMEITDKYTFFKGSNKKLTVRYRYCLTTQNIGQSGIRVVLCVLDARNSSVHNCCHYYFILFL
jgi:hypothetical protein